MLVRTAPDDYCMHLTIRKHYHTFLLNSYHDYYIHDYAIIDLVIIFCLIVDYGCLLTLPLIHRHSSTFDNGKAKFLWRTKHEANFSITASHDIICGYFLTYCCTFFDLDSNKDHHNPIRNLAHVTCMLHA